MASVTQAELEPIAEVEDRRDSTVGCSSTLSAVTQSIDSRPLGTEDRAGDRLLWSVLGGAAIIGIGLLVVGLALVDERQTVYVELAKSGLQLLVVGLLGSGLAALWRWNDQRRDLRQARQEVQLALFVRLVKSYNEAKAVRRTLRSLGLAQDSGSLDQRQVDGFRDQMMLLNQVQLDFEALTREIGEARLFDENSPEILTELHRIERHLNSALQIWEKGGASIDVGTDVSVVAAGLDGLIGDSAVFRAGVATPRRRATELMQDSLFGRSSEKTRSTLQRLEADSDARDQL